MVCGLAVPPVFFVSFSYKSSKSLRPRSPKNSFHFFIFICTSSKTLELSSEPSSWTTIRAWSRDVDDLTRGYHFVGVLVLRAVRSSSVPIDRIVRPSGLITYTIDTLSLFLSLTRIHTATHTIPLPVPGSATISFLINCKMICYVKVKRIRCPARGIREPSSSILFLRVGGHGSILTNEPFWDPAIRFLGDEVSETRRSARDDPPRETGKPGLLALPFLTFVSHSLRSCPFCCSEDRERMK